MNSEYMDKMAAAPKIGRSLWSPFGDSKAILEQAANAYSQSMAALPIASKSISRNWQSAKSRLSRIDSRYAGQSDNMAKRINKLDNKSFVEKVTGGRLGENSRFKKQDKLISKQEGLRNKYDETRQMAHSNEREMSSKYHSSRAESLKSARDITDKYKNEVSTAKAKDIGNKVVRVGLGGTAAVVAVPFAQKAYDNYKAGSQPGY